MTKEGQLNRFSVAIAAGAIAIGGMPAWAQDGGNDSASAPPAGQRTQQWTPDAMGGARALPLPQVNPEDVRAAGRTGQRTNRPVVEGKQAAEDLGPGGDKPGQRFSGDVTKKPLYWAGKLFYLIGQDEYVCSAQFISPDVILTAAHCVRDGDTGNWYTDFIFALQYNNGKFGKLYDYDCVATKNGWVQEGFEKYFYDYAMIKTTEPSTTGHFGTHWGWSGNYDGAIKIGYPGGVADGQVMQVETGPIRFVEGVVELTHGNEADQRGSSGGAWIGTAGGNVPQDHYIISVESFGFPDQPGVDYGPYLTEEFKDLFDYVQNGCQ